ncbi:hypothetical protein ACX0G9_03680 [Flavitalea flava]
MDESQYAKYEKGIGSLGLDKLLDLCSFWNINTDWLFTGKGEMFITKHTGDQTDEDATLIHEAKTLPDLNNNIEQTVLQVVQDLAKTIERHGRIMIRVEEKINIIDSRLGADPVPPKRPAKKK